jgi:hypothetical protein
MGHGAGGVASLGKYGPGAAKAIQKQITIRSIFLKGLVWRGGQIRGIWAWSCKGHPEANPKKKCLLKRVVWEGWLDLRNNDLGAPRPFRSKLQEEEPS